MTLPWSIIGWCIVIGVPTAVLYRLARRLIPSAVLGVRRLVAHRKSRGIAPLPGDVWLQGDKRLYITRIADNGRICMQTYSPNAAIRHGASWSDSPEDWADRVRARRLVLLEHRSAP